MADEHDESNDGPPDVLSGNYGVEESSGCEILHLAALINEEGTGVMMRFCQPISWMTFSPEEAISFGETLASGGRMALEIQKSKATNH